MCHLTCHVLAIKNPSVFLFVFCSGQFANDRISGHGEMHYVDGSVYKGQWMEDQVCDQDPFTVSSVSSFCVVFYPSLINLSSRPLGKPFRTQGSLHLSRSRSQPTVLIFIYGVSSFKCWS